MFSPTQPSLESARSQSALKHREVNHAIFNLATREPRTSNALECVPMFVKIAESLILSSKRRLETAHLPNRADRQSESNGLSLALLDLGHDPDILRHRCAFSVRKISVSIAPFVNGSDPDALTKAIERFAYPEGASLPFFFAVTGRAT